VGGDPDPVGGRPSRSRNVLYRLFAAAFLPQGYPDSVPADYSAFQLWDTVQGFCSYVRSMLTSHALLKGVGVGVEESSALGAVFVFLVRDMSGQLAGVLFAAVQGTGFDAYPKQWRLFADTMNNVGLMIDLMAPQLLLDENGAADGPGERSRSSENLFLALLCCGRVCFALVGVAGGASRSALTYHFSKDGRNAADISGKEGSQETLASLVGMLAGFYLLKTLDALERSIQTQVQWLVFSLLTLLHMYSNYRAVRSLQLVSLNASKVSHLWTRFSAGQVPSPADYAQYELSPLHLYDWVQEKVNVVKGRKIDIVFGEHPLGEEEDAEGQVTASLSDPDGDYGITLTLGPLAFGRGVRGTLFVSVREGAQEGRRKLKAYCHAVHIKSWVIRSLEARSGPAIKRGRIDEEWASYILLKADEGDVFKRRYPRISKGWTWWDRFWRDLKKKGWARDKVYIYSSCNN